ncbi:hypothetical protein [Ruegeria atlantica]|nr:hypothetical protein [Ruegeria atlantica]
MVFQISPPLDIPETVAAGSGPESTDARVLGELSVFLAGRAPRKKVF